MRKSLPIEGLKLHFSGFGLIDDRLAGNKLLSSGLNGVIEA